MTLTALPSPLARPLASRLPHRLLPHHLSGGHIVLGLGFGFRPAQSEQPAFFRAVLPGDRAGRGGRRTGRRPGPARGRRRAALGPGRRRTLPGRAAARRARARGAVPGTAGRRAGPRSTGRLGGTRPRTRRTLPGRTGPRRTGPSLVLRRLD